VCARGTVGEILSVSIFPGAGTESGRGIFGHRLRPLDRPSPRCETILLLETSQLRARGQIRLRANRGRMRFTQLVTGMIDRMRVFISRK